MCILFTWGLEVGGGRVFFYISMQEESLVFME